MTRCTSRMFPFFSNIRWNVLTPRTCRMQPFRRFLLLHRPICMLHLPVANTGHRFLHHMTRHTPRVFPVLNPSFVRSEGTM